MIREAACLALSAAVGLTVAAYSTLTTVLGVICLHEAARDPWSTLANAGQIAASFAGMSATLIVPVFITSLYLGCLAAIAYVGLRQIWRAAFGRT